MSEFVFFIFFVGVLGIIFAIASGVNLFFAVAAGIFAIVLVEVVFISIAISRTPGSSRDQWDK